MEKIEKLVLNFPQGVDCALIFDEYNKRYFTDYSFEGALIILKNGLAYCLTDFRYFEEAESVLKGFELVLVKNLFKEIGNIFRKNCCKTVLIEASKLSVSKFLKLKESFVNLNFIADDSLDCLIGNLRAVKTDGELKKIEAAQRVTELAFSNILNFLEEGRTEIEVAREIDRFILDSADGLAFKTIVVSGKNSSLPHGMPSSKKIEAFDFVTLDFGAKVDGFCSDMTRTVCIKNFSEFQKEIYDVVLFCQNSVLEKVKSGVLCSDLDKFARDCFKKFGYCDEFGHSLGHGVGLLVHENPNLCRSSGCVLEKNMVVTIEPGLYFKNKFGVRIEDMAVVQEEGVRNLTKCSKELLVV